MRQQIELTAYSLPEDRATHDKDIEDILRRAFDLQKYLEFYDEDVAEAITTVVPRPVVMLRHLLTRIRYYELEDKLGQFPDFYRYTFDLELVPPQLPGGPKVDKLSLRWLYISFDEFRGEGVTLKDLGTYLPRLPHGEMGVYCVANPRELWLTGKLKKDHIRAFFARMHYPHLKAWSEVESQYAYLLQGAMQASLAWGEALGEAPMVFLELLHEYADAPQGSSLLDRLVGEMKHPMVAEDAYVSFQSNPWVTLDAQVYRSMYAKPFVVDPMVEALTEFYVRRVYHKDELDDLDDVEYTQLVQDLVPVMEAIVDSLIDIFAPLIGEWRLTSFAAEMCNRRSMKIPVKEYPSLADGVQDLVDKSLGHYSVIRLQEGSSLVDLFLDPEESIPQLTLRKVERL